MWHLGLSDNNITYSLARQNFSKDIQIMYLTDYSEHETYYLISPHFSDLPEEEYEKAYYKALSFVRLINGCLLLKGDNLLKVDNCLTDFDDSYNSLTRGKEVSGRNLIEYAQFVNPFENIKIEDLKSDLYLANCLTMVKNDEKVRRVIGLLYLYHRDNLYLLVNAYKVYEIICADLGIPREKRSYKKICNGLAIPDMLPYLDYFILGNFTHYANTITSSDGTEVSGLFSRHGQSKNVYDENPLDLNELDLNLRNLINTWLSIKIKNYIGVVHKEKYEKRTDSFDI
ncbi:hypothetical protein [Lysinibacillus sp. BSL11]